MGRLLWAAVEVRIVESRGICIAGRGLVPGDAVAVGGALVVFEVAQNGALDCYAEVVTFIGAYGHKAGCHGEAVQVSGDAAVHVSNLVQVEIIAGREVEIPVLVGRIEPETDRF